jgi:coenzyme Q-binding protein COQ10
VKAEHSIQMACPAEGLMDVLCDFDAYPDFLPRVSHTKVVLSDRAMWEVDFRLEFVRSLDYTLRLDREPLALRWTLVRGFFRHNTGSWTLQPNDSGVLATYRIDLQPNTFVPRAVMNSLLRHELPRTLAAFRDRAELLTSAALRGGSAPADG